MPPTNRSAAPAAHSTSSQIIRVTSLNGHDFAPFGQVIHNPSRHGQPTGLKKVVANQGTATKWLDVTNMTNWYAGNAPSGKEAKIVMNMFVCKPRALEQRGEKKIFRVKILERHPFTPQTFIPMGVSAQDKDTRYLVIVAPTLESAETTDMASTRRTTLSKSLEGSLEQRLYDVQLNPYISHDEAVEAEAVTTMDDQPSTSDDMQPKGSGEPDLDKIKAFIASGGQAVTYGPGTWHAPMVVLGQKEIDFVVVQFSNDVALEDCQEHDVLQSVAVDVDLDEAAASAPGIMRAKL